MALIPKGKQTYLHRVPSKQIVISLLTVFTRDNIVTVFKKLIAR